MAPIDAMPRSTLNGTFTAFCDSATTTDFCTMSPGASVGAGKGAAQHHRVGAAKKRHGDRTMPADAAIRDDRQAPLDRTRAVDHRLKLRNAEARRQSCRAAATRPDADLDRRSAAVGQERRAIGGRHVPRDHVHLRESLRHLAERPLHHHRMAVRDVDDEHVHAGLHQLGCPLEVVAARANRRADPQPALGVARRKRQPLLPPDVARRHQARRACPHRPRAAAS